jgi:hypothetical protein
MGVEGLDVLVPGGKEVVSRPNGLRDFIDHID